jgi:PEP-CTERM motif-containing protein
MSSRIAALSVAAIASSTLISQAGAALLEFNKVVTDTYHAPINRGGIFRIVTDGVVDISDSFRGFDTFNGNTGIPVFAGLIQTGVGAQPQTFDTVTLNLGNQFVDGGNFASTPSLYLLLNNVDTHTSLPTFDANWSLVSNATLSQVGLNYTFTLGGPVAGRTAYGFAVGGVEGSGAVRFLSVSELSATGTTTRAKMQPPAQVVASIYHAPDTRAAAFTLATNGDVSPGGGFDNNRDFDTFEGAIGQVETDFGGLLYSSAQQFDTVTLSYGTNFGDGGRFAENPRLFLNFTGVDTDTTLPETDPLNWREVVDAVLDRQTDGETFDLTELPLAQRIAYGWAIGGVNGNGNGSANPQNFITISELSASGTVPEPSTMILLGAGALLVARRRRIDC